ncbi:chondroitin sulfate proteoglycan 4-like [Cheilinus undulatus]|uniref:chondroitin sulfate proteoglycan 4-like n=1 Tax=Cheilinus undulatus TaxID=241271 RepID=UPI001BD5E3CF|nr:chondroitin sulfate proteoglycan 4-like [Cheilinus undulatus]
MGRYAVDLFLLLLISTGQVYGESFFGDGYIHLRTEEASIETVLHVRFRTSSQTGLLFLAAGHRDFLLLELTSGRLQVRLELGSGERSLRSEKGLFLSDLAWHSLELIHFHHSVNMTVDRNSHTSLRMPGPDLRLNIEDGLFVGGAAGLKHPNLLKTPTGFRGCIDEAVFNEHNLLSSLRPYSGYKSVHEVSPGCSSQFSATEEDSVSFFSSRAFIVLPPLEFQDEGVFQCELRPSAREEDGMVLYSSGNSGGFVAIELRDGHLVATLGNGKGSKTEMRSLTDIHHNHIWYSIKLHLLPHSIHLSVGKEQVQANLSPELQAIQLKGSLFLGGLNKEARVEARRAGMMSGVPGGKLAGGGVSFKGCLRDIRVNTKRTGLPNASITKDITVGCLTRQTSVEVATQSPIDHQKFDVTTLQPSTSTTMNPTFLSLRKLEVVEGGRALLEPKHIRVNLDFRKLGIHPAQLMFRVERQPAHGQLRLDLSPDSDGMLSEAEQDRTIILGTEEFDQTFSMLDLWQGRVMYVHSGSEDQNDFFMFSVFSNNKKKLPASLKGNRLHRFDVDISPVNDIPVLSLPEGNLFTLVEKSKRQLTSDMLRVSDPDSSPEELMFSSLGNLNNEAGHLEHQDYPGRPINLFSLNDLEEGKISFVHTGISTSRLALRVSDGERSSNTVIFRIMAVPLEHKLVNNTGLEVNQGEASTITTINLAVQVNGIDQAVDIRYNITELPQYGELQRLHSNGDWKPTTFFSQNLLKKERIRYVSAVHGLQTHDNITDHFKCIITIGAMATEEIVFSIVVHCIQFKVLHSKLEVNGVLSTTFTSEDLHVISTGIRLNENALHFRLLTLPKKGHLYLNNRILKKKSTFSQKNITDGLVKYELFNKLQYDTRDTFSFQVFSSHINSATYNFRINIKAESTTITVLNKGLSVLEGASKVINKDILFSHTAGNREVFYSITASPRHGQIRRINFSNSTSINDDILTFTNQDITEERIMYVHDDSETKEDSFTFKVMIHKPHKHISKKEDDVAGAHRFNISVQLVNDQRPVRVVDKVFHVARYGQRLVTLDDLRYRDDDSDFEESWLVYTRRGIPMGDLVLASDPSHKLYEFTQRDLEQKKVLFVHRGVSFGRFVLFVSDGKHYVSTLMEVIAQDPYLKAENNTGIRVQKGGLITLTSANLSISSNLDIREPQEVTFQVFLPPKHGVLFFKDEDREALTQTDSIKIFTQQDLVEERLVYQHDGSQELSDHFNVTARAKERGTERRPERGRREVRLDIGVLVKIYLESHQRPPIVISNLPLQVEEGRNVSISREHLEVAHEDSQPSDILFSVQSPPTQGFLQRCTPAVNQQHYNNKEQLRLCQNIREQQTNSFTQEDLNQGWIIYHHETVGGDDSVLLEATNGITKVGPIRLDIDVIPLLLPLQVSALTLDEGSSVPLTSDVIKVTNYHFSGMNFLYQVIDPPLHGHLEHSRIPGMLITAFTHTEVERQYISYVHDGSETERDNFTILANQTEIKKHSLPCIVHIHVIPVNDETPVVTTNKGLKVWEGSVTEITPDELSAEDVDTPDEALEFIITPPSNGHLALKSAPSRQILNFTQNHIQTGQLVFVHSGALSGGFQFQVNDGMNFAPRQIFSTTAHSLDLVLQRNHPMKVYPGSVTPISEQELKAVTNDVTDIKRNQTVVFAVTAPPRLGRLVQRLPDNSTQNITTFTQSMVNDGVVLYDQNKPQAVGWSATDSFSFTVSSPPAFLSPHTFNILISYQANEHHDNPQYKTGLVSNAGAVVDEGGSVMIDSSKLDASNLLGRLPESHKKDHYIMYRVISMPRHGALSIRGNNLTRTQPNFSQVTLNKFGITYNHDDSETTSDSFTFRAWVAPLDPSSSFSSSSTSMFPSDSSFSSSSSPFSSLYSASSLSSLDIVSQNHVKDSLEVTETFNITVTPVNDHPPLIRSRNPSLKVVVGERVVLGPDNLQVEDHDTPPEELHYLVISMPNNGYLTLGERPEPVTSFTQYDINHGRLHFIQQGEPSTGVFYFNVTDGHHRPLYKLFSLEVVKPSVSIVNNTGLSLVQGKTAVILTTNQLAAQTNGHSRANISYTVTIHPRHGRIAIYDHEVTSFWHEDLLLHHVVYHMTELSESEDSFAVLVSASSHGVHYGNATAQVKVTVQPLIHLREQVRVPSGIAVKLGKAMMDASELARISRADPVFEVLSPPKHGKLVKITYDPNQASEVLKSFTFRDVVQGRIAIEETLSDNDNQPHENKSALAVAGGHAPATPLNDSFTFLLRAGNVQPAKGELHFTIFPHHHMHQGPGGPMKVENANVDHTTTRFPIHNKTTTTRGRGAGRGVSTTQGGVRVGAPPRISAPKNRTLHKQRNQNRWGNQTRSGNSGGRSGSSAEAAGGDHSPTPQPQTPSVSHKHGLEKPSDNEPVHVQVLPRPASDPLLIILPLLACLLLIVIFIVLILVFRRRKEKQARQRILQQIAAVTIPPEGSPYLGRAERSVAMPSVVVTPLSPQSCPTSPRVSISPRRRSLSPGMTFWGPFDTDGAGGDGNIQDGTIKERDNVSLCTAEPAVVAAYNTTIGSMSPTPSLKRYHYWV